MAAFVALLRGVNVGKGNRVPMADLRALLVDLGFDDVATLLNSGNAVFTGPTTSAARHAAAIAAGLTTRLGVSVPVIVKSAADLEAIVAGSPLAAPPADPSRVLVAFTQDTKALDGLAPVASMVTPPERFVVGAHAAYLHCPNGILQSKAGEALLGKAGRAATTRNWATTLKLLALVRERR